MSQPASDLTIELRPARIEIEAVVVRADGSLQDLGVVAYWHRNPLRRAWWQAKRLIASRFGVSRTERK